MVRETMKSFVEQPLFILSCFLVIAASTLLLATPYYYFALFPALGIGFIFFMSRFPVVGFFLILFLVPFQNYTALFSSLQFLTISKVVGIWLVFLGGVGLLLKRIPLRIFRSNVWPILVLFFLAALLASVPSAYPAVCADNLRKLLIQYFFFAIALYFLANVKTFKTTLPSVLVVSITIGSLLSIIGYVFDVSMFAMNLESESVKRGVGAAHDPNYFAVLIIYNLPLIAFLFFRVSTISVRLLFAALFFINTVAVVLTYSRSGALILVIILLLLGAVHLHRLRVRYIGLVAIGLLLAGVAVVALLPSSYVERQKSITNIDTERSLGRRVSYLYVGWDMFKKNPILGSGPGTFKEVYGNTSFARQFEKKGKSDKRVAHNGYLEMIVGMGMVGIVLYLVLHAMVLKNFFTAIAGFRKKGDADSTALVVAYLLSYVTMLLSLLVLSSQYHKYIWLSFAISELAKRFAQIPDKDDNGSELAWNS